MSEKDTKISNAEALDALNCLMNMQQMWDSFVAAETEGLIICENCCDTAFDDDENLRTFEDADGQQHIFCCEECMNEWKGSHNA